MLLVQMLRSSLKVYHYTFAFGAIAAFFAPKYLLMPLLIFSCFSLSSSRFRLATQVNPRASTFRSRTTHQLCLWRGDLPLLRCLLQHSGIYPAHRPTPLGHRQRSPRHYRRQ
jgi:hypothetical protein